jgi:hypothetical protein
MGVILMSVHIKWVCKSFVVTAACLLVLASRASAQSVTFNFEDGTDQGFGLKFSNDASKNFPIVTIGGSKRMEVQMILNAFQQADIGTGDTNSALFMALAAAAANEAGYQLSYDYYIDTSLAPGQYGGFLQIGSYFNTGNGYYAQDFGTPKEVELNGAQLAASAVYSGHVSVNLAAPPASINMPAGDNFYRLGLIINGDGANAKVYFDNITLAPVPEPASLALFGLGGVALTYVAIRRRVG